MQHWFRSPSLWASGHEEETVPCIIDSVNLKGESHSKAQSRKIRYPSFKWKTRYFRRLVSVSHIVKSIIITIGQLQQ
jgi:hypothetical protein